MFETNDNVYILKKHENESYRFYYEKSKYFSQCNLKTNTIEYYLKLSHMYANHIIYGCNYDNIKF